MKREDVVLKVRDLMTKNLVSVKSEKCVMEAARLMDEKEISSVLVKRGEDFCGLITDRDIPKGWTRPR
jgi:CBS domain-containing protein